MKLKILRCFSHSLLSSFFPSKPIPVGTTLTPRTPDPEKSTPSWTPPLGSSRPSLKSIQLQQEKKTTDIIAKPKNKNNSVLCDKRSGFTIRLTWFEQVVQTRG